MNAGFSVVCRAIAAAAKQSSLYPWASVDTGLFGAMRNIHVGYDLGPQVNFDNGLNIGLKMRF